MTEQTTPPPLAGEALIDFRPAPVATVDRLRDGPPADQLTSWLVTLGITALAFFLRIWNVGYPKYLVFDETYYAKDAWSILKFGYEREWPDNVNDAIAGGVSDLYSNDPSFIVHPPVGKWLIALGEAMFGMNSFGWRISAVVFGSLLVLFTIRLARRLSRSTLIGAIAGILLTFDGLAFTLSRIALLDIFQATFLVAAVSAVVADRDWFRHRLARYLDVHKLDDLGGQLGPIMVFRPWLLVAGLVFGLAVGTKWNSIYVLAVFGVLSVLWDVGARRLAGADFKQWWALAVDGIPAFFWMVVVALITYVSSWWGWITSDGGWDRDWAVTNPDEPLAQMFPEWLASLMWYHKEIYEFHTGDFINAATHPYDAHPAGWIFMIRPIGMDAVNDIPVGSQGCTGSETCLRVISGMGTPALWWFAAIALGVATLWWWAGRDWRFSVPVLAVAATWLPWFMHTSRPLFFFYAITIIPFSSIALALVLGLVLGQPQDRHRRWRALAVGVVVALVLLNFAYIWPLLTDTLLPYSQWLSRMWLQTWI